MSDVRAWRAALVHCLDDPGRAGPDAVVHHADGLLLVEDGCVAACGAWADLAPTLAADVIVEALPGRLLSPGFIDTHIHFPQIDMIAAFSGQLLDWLEHKTFPAERAFADRSHADAAAQAFLDELLRNGTTTAMVFGSVHRASVDALFEAALARNMRLIAGKSLMDRGPADLSDTEPGGRAETEVLIRDWSRRGRLGYAVTPRFALSSSPEQLASAGEILRAHDHVWMQTHLAENPREVEAVARAFPDARDYLDVYDRFGLVTDRSVFAHCIHMSDRSLHRMSEAGAAISHCPTSNLFLGSGLFDLARAQAHGVAVGLGTDVGAGTSFSMLSTAAAACNVAQMRGGMLDPLRAFWLATRGGARALGLEDRIGSFAVGCEADFVALDTAATPLLARRLAGVSNIREILFALMVLGDDRVVADAWLAGVRAHRRG
ncbi:MAG: guanine deaminase [Caulobacter sp.]|nr:guanine deaminase [Caulobacter sp.]